mmetsp:Transcript_36116/g.69259  ORF Transcript_36116/g.69259 Transcript_36116/m.69259 type:complete len:212 (+) Transcript_36116:628-1263(+)
MRGVGFMADLTVGLRVSVRRSWRSVSMSKLLASSVSVLCVHITSQHVSRCFTAAFVHRRYSRPAAVSHSYTLTTIQHVILLSVSRSCSNLEMVSVSCSALYAPPARSFMDNDFSLLSDVVSSWGRCSLVCSACRAAICARSAATSSCTLPCASSLSRALDMTSDRMLRTCHRDLMRPTNVFHLRRALADVRLLSLSLRVKTFSAWPCSSSS